MKTRSGQFISSNDFMGKWSFFILLLKRLILWTRRGRGSSWLVWCHPIVRYCPFKIVRRPSFLLKAMNSAFIAYNPHVPPASTRFTSQDGTGDRVVELPSTNINEVRGLGELPKTEVMAVSAWWMLRSGESNITRAMETMITWIWKSISGLNECRLVFCDFVKL